MFETAHINNFPYSRTAFAEADLPDRVIEAPAFLSLICRVSPRIGFEGWMRIVACEEIGGVVSDDETACEIEIVMDRDFESGACRIPAAWQDEIFDTAADLLEEIFEIPRNMLDLANLSPFETQHLHEESLRFNIMADLCSEILAWNTSRLRALAARPEVELLRLP